MSKIGMVLAIGFLLISGATGIQGSVTDWPEAATSGQKLSTLAVALMGFFGVGAGVGALFRRGWTLVVVLAWGAALTLASGLAPVVWGDAGIGTGIASAFLGALLAALTFLGVSSRVRPPSAQEANTTD